MCASRSWVRLVEYVPLDRRPLLRSPIWRRDLVGPQFGGVSVGRGSIFARGRGRVLNSVAPRTVGMSSCARYNKRAGRWLLFVDPVARFARRSGLPVDNLPMRCERMMMDTPTFVCMRARLGSCSRGELSGCARYNLCAGNATSDRPVLWRLVVAVV